MPYGGNDWLALTQEPTLEPEIPICDPHHHFWDVRPDRIPYQRYLLHELAADVNCGHNDGGHFVRKVTLDGKVLPELGVPGKPAPYMSGEPFHRCTHTALSPKGEIYVSDGYGNSRVHKYSPMASC